ncbi:MAG: SIMPL domain-containing protein [bacterium]
MDTFFDKKSASQMGKVVLFLGVVTVLYMGMKFVNETKKFSSSSEDVSNVSTIDVSGTGTSFAIPDVASESFTVQQKSATVHDAQTSVASSVNNAVSFLKKSGIEEKDIQTTNYSAYPEYTYPTPCIDKGCSSVNTTPKLVGYSVTQTITVKIRDTAKVGTIVDGLGSLGVTGLSGPDFTVDNADAVNADARKKAIADAESKARILAHDLGVTLVRIVRFSEGQSGGVAMPMYAKAEMATGSTSDASTLPVGQNKYVSNVTITYEIQ